MSASSESSVSYKRRLQRERAERHRQRRFCFYLGNMDQMCYTVKISLSFRKTSELTTEFWHAHLLVLRLMKASRDLLQNDSDHSHNARHYNAPAASDVAAIIVGDGYEIELSR
ncbi:hypothetical protein RhiirA5_410045 [Rhizophagus irregularis]|uniref:Uncharacterized protein n=1 Tax=Rhizophagus irregularis TaxID=588596 RepID=A0A2N0Q4C8_9GLOM|nr:hypothetical protein RhiirA5_410045 [Rhizophagus irregularis]CAB5112117.1 unnamed protein product [Rhizophagus irregularis]